MYRKFSSVLRVLLFATFGIVLLWLIFRNQDIDLIYTNLKKANYYWASMVFVFGFISNINRSARWNMLLEPLGYKPKLYNTFIAVLIGYFANLGLPRMGEVFRCSILNRYENVPVDKSFGTVVTERIIDVISLFVCLAIVLLFEFERVSNIFYDFIVNPILNKLQSLLGHSANTNLIAMGVLLVLLVLLFLIWKFILKSSYYERIIKILNGFNEGLLSIRKVKNIPLLIFHTAMMWVMYWMMAYLCFNSFDFTAMLSPLTGFVVMVFGGFGFAAPVQGGFGVFHFIVSQTLAQYGVEINNGLSYALLNHSVQTISVILFGLIALIALPIINKPKSKSET
ncbi:MAG: lysylphosphatidylglycerol synthase transmembrane domain-containing protein [Bacteroidota bacterium]